MKLLNIMETVRLDTPYDLLLQKTKSTNTESEIKNITQPINHIYFVICNSCYWCATYFGTDDLDLRMFSIVMLVIHIILNLYP
jgi:hypothetical protein